jgi:iron complex transport system substrate-binding protein
MLLRHVQNRARIVSLAPSVTSILAALGARRELVGVTKWCPDVANVGALPQLGDCWAIDVAAVARLRPTLIIGSVPYKTETVAKLLTLPSPFLATNPRSLADIEAEIRLLGGLTGRAQRAEQLIGRMRREFAAVARLARRARSRPRVYCEAWPHPRISSPPWVAELVELAGGRMAVPPGRRVTDRQVAGARPDVIVLAWAATGARARISSALANPAWKRVPAVREGRVHVIRDELLNTPGPPLLDGARALLLLIHPEIRARGRKSTG